MIWEIRTRLGVGSLRLGMIPQEVGAILDPMGKIEAEHTAFDGSVNQFRSMDLPICNYIDGSLAQIDTTPHMPDVSYKGRNVYKADARDKFELFEADYKEAFAGLSFILFLQLNVYLQNFFDARARRFFDVSAGEQDDRRVAVFAAGRFDKLMSRFKPFEVS